MQRFIPKNKLSKKKQREINSLARRIWKLDPVTRVEKNNTKYDRNVCKRVSTTDWESY